MAEFSRDHGIILDASARAERSITERDAIDHRRHGQQDLIAVGDEQRGEEHSNHPDVDDGEVHERTRA